LSDKDLRFAGRAGIDVSACGITTYDNTANAVPNFLCNLTTLQGKFFWPKLLTNDDNRCIMVTERKRELKMEKVTSVNGFIGSLPKIRKRKIWSVIIDGKVVQGVGATDNREETARAYIASKYPGQVFTLKFVEWRI